MKLSEELRWYVTTTQPGLLVEARTEEMEELADRAEATCAEVSQGMARPASDTYED